MPEYLNPNLARSPAEQAAAAPEARDWRKEISAEKVLSVSQAIQQSDRVAAYLRMSGMVVAPTDTLYGLLARVTDEVALERLFRLKGRSLERQVPLFIDDPKKSLPELVTEVSPLAEKLIEHFWPGPLTLVLPAKPGLSRFLVSTGTGVGVRQPAHPVIRAILQALGEPVTGTSANLSGAPAPNAVAQISGEILSKADLVIDGGTLPGIKGSTVLDLTGPEVRILRQGDLPLSRIQEVIAL